jgi:nitric oxide dioxygenase
MSFITVMDRKAEAGRMFYERLFAAAPELRPMFNNDMDAQSHKFIEMLAIIIGLLNDPTALSQTLTQLAHRHRGYGVRDEHFDLVRDALLRTLAKILGETFTPELRNAWRDLYGLVASAMKRSSPTSVNV